MAYFRYIFFPAFKAKTRTGSTPLLSRRSKTSLLQHTLEEHKRNSRGLNRESSPIIMKVTQIAKMCDAGIMPTVQVLLFADTVNPLFNCCLGDKQLVA